MTGEIQLSDRYALNTILYADDWVLMLKSEDELHISAYHLNKIAKKYNSKISISKAKLMGMCSSIKMLKISDRRKNY
jgi:hypothetical protein